MWNQKGSEHWVTAVHSSEDKCNLYYLDTWESKDAQRARMPEDIVANVNCFLAQQNPSIAMLRGGGVMCLVTGKAKTPPSSIMHEPLTLLQVSSLTQ